ncbi:MAG TPA: DUF4126 domain-containing protein [Candidatus Dormibacteraeota bacterium]|nr:DUF4126 domain-containing protein [Candidatus Dormibacteraeota bacterium]
MQYALAYALSSAAGVRALLALAIASLAIHAGWMHPPPSLLWLGSMPVTIALLALAAVEIFADKLPLLDHALHVAQIVLKPMVAAILVVGSLHGLPGPELVGLVALGALNALGIHAATASARGASTLTTGGMANPILSLGEDVGALLLALFGFLLPWLGALLALLVGATAVWVLMRVRHTIAAKRTASGD